MSRRRPLRLFHFDIKTFGNYGDTLLYEAVRQTFNGFGGGECFEIYETRGLREPVTPGTIEWINSTCDAVLIGGGGLFLRDTNPNQRSGWQWNISLDLLKAIEKPLIVFAVGNNSFIGQEEFFAPFHTHVSRTLEQSVFFGLRNNGSVDTIREQLPSADRDRVVLQPCPTTISSQLFPDLYRDEISDERRIGLQLLVGRRQQAVGFDAAAISDDVIEVGRRLVRDGWTIDSVPHALGDVLFEDRAFAAGLPMRRRPLFADPDGLYAGPEYFADLPIMLGARGHAQMVPFGMGSIPVSVFIHHKLRYFADDIGHAELAVDPRADSFVDRLHETVRIVDENRVALHKELAETRERFFRLTLDNLATIYRRLTGEVVAPNFTAYTPAERRLAGRTYAEGIGRSRSDQRLRELLELSDGTAESRDALRIDARRLHARARAAAARGDYATARTLLRAVDALVPDFFARRTRPRWDSGASRAIPARALEPLTRLRRRR